MRVLETHEMGVEEEGEVFRVCRAEIGGFKMCDVTRTSESGYKEPS